MNKTISRVLDIIPYSYYLSQYNKNLNKHNKQFDIAETEICKKFFSESSIAKDFSGVLERVKKNKKYCIIQKVLWEHHFINVCFIGEVLSLIAWCLESGYFPVIDINTVDENGKKKNVWNELFKQPFDVNIEDAKNDNNSIVCPINSFIWISMHDARNPQKVSILGKLFNEFVQFKNPCQEYIDNEYNTILKGKKVLGALIRGTEYTRLKLKDHAIQPSIEEFIDKVEEVLVENNLDYVYLATEDSNLADRVFQKFGEKVLTNKRKYYDIVETDDSTNGFKRIEDTRENATFLKSLEYFSSLNLVSKCESLVAGLCGGSEAAVFMNNNTYSVCYLFDKGVY